MAHSTSHPHPLPKLFLAAIVVLCLPILLSAQSDFDSLAKSAASARETGNIPLALHDYQAAVRLRPDWQEGWWYLGTLNYDGNQYAEAISAFHKLLALDPRQGSAWNFLGLCEFELKDYANSRVDIAKAISLDTGDDPEITRVSQYHLALLLIRDAQFRGANRLLTTLAAKEDSQPIRFAEGLALLRVPLVPAEIDPSREALLTAAGEVASLVNRGEIAKALALFKKLVEAYPTIPYLHYSYGQTLESTGKSAEATEQLWAEAKLSRDSSYPPSVPQDGERESSIIALYRTSVTSDAAIASSSRGNPELWNAAMQAYSAAHYPEAIAALKTWVISDSTNGTAWAVMGLSEFALKDYDNALIHLQRGNELRPGGSADSVQLAKYTLAVLLNRRGQHDSATRLLAGETGTGAIGKEITFVLGMALLHIPGLPDDVQLSGRALVSSAGEIALLLQQSKYDLALPKLESLLEEHPATPFLHYAYGVALASLSEYPQAEEQFRREALISRQSELPQLRLASLSLRARRPSDAISPAKQALLLAPNSAEAHYLLGRAYLDLNQKEEAVRELENASSLEPLSPEIHFNLAKAYAKAKQPEKADEERATFKRLNDLVEKQKSLRGNQSYGGSRDSSDISLPVGTPSAAPAQKDEP